MWDLLSRRKLKSFQFTAPSRWRPLNHRTLRALCRRPRRVFGGCALHGYAGSEGNRLFGRGGSEEEEVGGLLLLLLLGALTNKGRQTIKSDKCSRSNRLVA